MNRRVIATGVASLGSQALSVVVAAFALFSGHASGTVTVANYTFTGNSFASSDTDNSSSAGNIVIGAGLSGSAAISSSNVGSNPPALAMGADATPATEADAITGNDYISLTVTPSPGVSLAYAGINFNVDTQDFTGNPLTINIALRSSVDGFFSTLGTYTDTNNGGGQNSFAGGGFTISSLPAQSVAVEFRFYFYDDGSASSSLEQDAIDNIAVLATLVPEPSSWALLAFGGVFLGWRQRGRRG